MTTLKGFYHSGLIVSLALIANSIRADDALFQSKPNRCIALHQGQECFQKLNFTWSTPKQGQYCLYQKNIDPPLICWEGDQLTRYRFKFRSPKNEIFYIRNVENEAELANTTITVAWVYKSRKKVSTGWRLF